MLDKAQQPGPLQDKAMAKMKAAAAVVAGKTKQEAEDMGPILRT